MNAIRLSLNKSAETAGDYMAVTMRTIQTLQKQLQQIGERYQQELAQPSASGTAQQELMRQLASQMQSIQNQIETLQQSIVQRQAVDAMRRQESEQSRAGSVIRFDVGRHLGSASQEAGAATDQPEDVARGPEGREHSSNPMRTVGVIIDTSA